MFGWLRKKQRSEHRRLIFQNSMASGTVLQAAYDRMGRPDVVEQLIHFAEQTRSIEGRLQATGSIDNDDAKSLLEINRELRSLHDYAERNGPEARMRKWMGQAAEQPDFDKAYQPTLGWDEFLARSD